MKSTVKLVPSEWRSRKLWTSLVGRISMDWYYLYNTNITLESKHFADKPTLKEQVLIIILFLTTSTQKSPRLI